MEMQSARGWNRSIATVLAVALLLAGVAGVTGASAHPGHAHGKAAAGATGLGIEVEDEFYSAVQWADSGEIDDQEARLVYAGTGCTPINYALADDLDGNIALVESGPNPDDPTDPCPVATFFQKVRSAQAMGAIGFVAIPAEGEEPNSNATVVDADIPALELHRDEAVDQLREDVIGGEPIVAKMVKPDPLELERLSDEPCVNGEAGPFECDDIDLLSFVPQEEFNGDGISDLWGWTDPDSGDEYVIIGKTNGVGFFEVTDPTDPVYLGELPNPGLLQEIWHDIKVYDDHAFIVSESEPHGMTVFDLTRLRDVEEPQEWDRDAWYPLTSAAHNVEINTETGFAYIVGGNAALVVPDACLSGLHMVDINDPKSPRFAGCYFEEGGPGTLARTAGEPVTDLSPAAYVHDTQCVVYDGPDERYEGQEICFNSAEDKVVIADVTDKLSPTTLGSTAYDHVGYTHQGWLTEDHRYLIVNDELDELEQEQVTKSRTIVLDVTDLENPKEHLYYDHDTESITHNNYVVGDLVYQSNYTSGLRVLDVTGLDAENVEERDLEEIAFFDTFPSHGEPTFEGTWSNYPFFESGTIAVSGIDEGLFLLRLAADAPEDEDLGVEVTCVDCQIDVRAGESATADFTVTNTGDADDTYELSIEGLPEDWNSNISDQPVTVPGDDAELVRVSFEIPRRTQAGEYQATLTAVSVTDASVSDSDDVGVTVTKGQPSDPGKSGDNGPPEHAGGPEDRGQRGPSSVSATPAAAAGQPFVPGAWVAALAVGLLAASIVSRRLAAR